MLGYLQDTSQGRAAPRGIPGLVLLIDNATGQRLQTIRADRTGLYEIALPQPSGLGLRVWARGYALRSEPLRVMPDQVGSELRKDTALAPLAVGMALALPGVRFLENSTRLAPQSEPVLEQLVDYLKLNPSLTVRIGARSPRPDADAARVEARYRALQVQAFLQARGILAARLDSGPAPAGSLDDPHGALITVTAL